MDDIIFTFDMEPFQNSMKSITESIDKLANVQQANQVNMKEMSQSGIAGMGGLIKKAALFGGVLLGISAALKQMPEIGKTFSIAGDIISKNLFWPLRKEILPLLQKVLNWVRDNRAMFVKWGNVLVNIFRVIKQIVINFINLLKDMWERLSAGIERVFGKTVRTLTETVNVFIFKIAVVAEFLMSLLRPVFKFLIDMFIKALGWGKALFKGLISGAENLMEPLGDVFSQFRRIFKLISRLAGKGQTLNKVFGTLGTILAMTLGPVLRAIAQVIDAVATAVENLILSLKLLKAWRANDTKKMLQIQREQYLLGEKFKERAKKRWGDQLKAWKQGGRTIKKIWTETKDDTAKVNGNVVKNVNNRRTSKTDITVNMGNQNITVRGSNDARNAGKEFGNKVYDQIRSNINKDKMVRGGQP